MIRRLGAYNLGVCLPHSHDDETGAFSELPDDVVSVERGQRVSFQKSVDVADPAHFVEVGWRWVGDAVTGMMACHMKCVTNPHGGMHFSEHMPE